ncbi:hypothetical protein [Bradyrhizobium sp. 141]|nr:hypothetical protein [Bradyrhizobium sp. 141]MCK1723575.1 hypothetical protein [Bradyrhizobium sp. 141]
MIIRELHFDMYSILARIRFAIALVGGALLIALGYQHLLYERTRSYSA